MAPGTPLDKARMEPRTLGEARRRLLLDRGHTLSALAKRFGRDLSLVSRVVSGKKRSRPIERKIARALGLPVEAAFPEQHEQADGAA